LQADLAGHRLADAVTNAGDLGIEGIQREQRPALVCWSEQRRQIPVLVGHPDEVFAMLEGGIHAATVA